MDHEQPHHHKHHREEPHHQTGGASGHERKLPFHPAWLYVVGFVLTILVILVWTLLI